MNENKIHIVIIEDDPVLRELTHMAYSFEGYQVDMFENGKEGISYLEDNLNNVDFILLDLFMPVQDGAFVLNWLRNIKKSNVCTLLMTAVIDLDTEKAMLAAGADKVIKKPLDVRTLLMTTKELLNL